MRRLQNASVWFVRLADRAPLRLVVGILACALAGAAGAARFNMTGHWMGQARNQKGHTVTLDGTFQAGSGSKLTGEMTVRSDHTDQCHVQGNVNGSSSVSAKITCESGTRINYTGRLNTRTSTIDGTFSGKGGDGKSTHGRLKFHRQ